jgi:hypothetical protein
LATVAPGGCWRVTGNSSYQNHTPNIAITFP